MRLRVMGASALVLAGCSTLEMPDPDAPPPPATYELEDEVVTTSGNT